MSAFERAEFERWKRVMRPKHRAVLHTLGILCTKVRENRRKLDARKSVSLDEISRLLKPDFRVDLKINLDWLCLWGLARWNPRPGRDMEYFFTPQGLHVWKLVEKERRGLL